MNNIPSPRPLQKMFMAVPPSYDRLNRLLTFRMDEVWRKKAARVLLEGEPEKVLDLCTGTGDLALHLAKRAKSSTEVLALDYSKPMLEVAKSKASGQQISNVDFLHGDAAAMPFSDAAFDGVGIAFAFRNLTYKNPDTPIFLREILRVLKPGGQFVAVETSQPSNGLLRGLYHFYMRFVTVPLGGLLSGHRGAYHYLAHSAILYYRPQELKNLLLEAGFSQVKQKPLLGGIAALWICRK